MYILNRNRLTDINKLMITKGEQEGGEGQIRRMKLRDTNYYRPNRKAAKIYCA